VRIAVLDGKAVVGDDLSWSPLEQFGALDVYDATPPEQVVPRGEPAEALVINKIVLDTNTLTRLPKLRYVGVTATGYNVVDIATARKRGVVVTNVPAYGTDSVAQLVFALLLELCHRVGHHAQTVRDGRWAASEQFCYWDFPLVELTGKPMGIVGYGRIGRRTVEIARAFRMRVIAHDIRPNAMAADGVTAAALPALFERSDVVSLHCPLTKENAAFVNSDLLGRMKPTAFLINTARGQLVNEADLAKALNEGRIAGAGLDVLDGEPPRSDNPLLTARNCVITPHIAWATRESRRRLLDATVANLRAFLANDPTNVVS
jgi:glycerate dehydrogenase